MLLLCIVYFFGAFLQLFPVGWLVLDAFEEEQFRRGKDRTRAGLTVLCAAGSFLFALITYLFVVHVGVVTVIEGSLFLNLMAAMLVIYIWRNIQAERKGRFLALLLGIHYEAIVVAANTVLMGLDRMPQWAEFDEACYSPAAPVGLLVITLASWPVMQWFFGHLLRDFLKSMEGVNIRSACVYVTIAMGTTFLGTLYFIDEAESASLTFMVLSLLSNSVTYYLFLRETRDVKDKEMLLRQVDLMELQYRQISSHIQDMSRLRHDIRHHLRTISVLNSEGKTEEIARYLEEYQVTYRNLDGTPPCGYMPVDSVLSYYMAKAAESGIHMTVSNSLGSSYGFSAVDITVLLGNCLENAVESCRRSEKAEPFIQVELQVINAALLIRIMNSARTDEGADQEFQEYQFLSSSKGKDHGIGMNSVEQIADKYKGSVEIRRRREDFAVRMVLMIPDREM